jgi:predicted ATPase
MQSALRVNPSFSLNEENREWVVRIYQLTEGMPLGIELATA